MRRRLFPIIGLLILCAGIILATGGSIGHEARVVRTAFLTTMAITIEERFSTSSYTSIATITHWWVGGEGSWHEVEVAPWHYVWFVLRAESGERIKGSILLDHGLFAEFSLMDREAFQEYKSAKTLVEQEGVRRRRAIINIIEPKVLQYMPREYQKYYESTPEGNRFNFEAGANKSDYYYAVLMNPYETAGLKIRFRFYVEGEALRTGERTLRAHITETKPTIIEVVETATERRAGLEDPRTPIGLIAILIGAISLAAGALKRALAMPSN